MDTFPDIAITPIAPEHIEGLRHSIDVVARERRYLDIFEAAPLDKFREYTQKQISNGDPFFVAMALGEVVGWCEVERDKGPANAHCGTLNIAILPAFRGRGLGFKLISTVLQQARRAGFVRIALWVHADNARAIALYEKVGFVREGLFRAAVLIDGKLCDTLVMAIVDDANIAKAVETVNR
jgi:RimJ/RimL family protein N-acetyltransferase